MDVDVGMPAMAASSGVAIKADPMQWGIFLGGLVVITAVSLAIWLPINFSSHVSDSVRSCGGLITFPIAFALLVGFIFAMNHWSASVDNANAAVVESHYKVSNLKLPQDCDLSSTNDGTPIRVGFRDSRGTTEQGSLSIRNGRAVLYVKGDSSRQVEYKADFADDNPYSYSDAAVQGISIADDGTKGN